MSLCSKRVAVRDRYLENPKFDHVRYRSIPGSVPVSLETQNLSATFNCTHGNISETTTQKWHWRWSSENCTSIRLSGIFVVYVIYFYSPFAETRQRKQSKPRVATADSKGWTKRAVSSVYSLHSDVC
jgi:hypothetical protein